MTGPRIRLIPLNDWAKLIRQAASSLLPSTVTYRLAAVSRNASPLAMVNNAKRKKP